MHSSPCCISKLIKSDDYPGIEDCVAYFYFSNKNENPRLSKFGISFPEFLLLVKLSDNDSISFFVTKYKSTICSFWQLTVLTCLVKLKLNFFEKQTILFQRPHEIRNTHVNWWIFKIDVMWLIINKKLNMKSKIHLNVKSVLHLWRILCMSSVATVSFQICLRLAEKRQAEFQHKVRPLNLKQRSKTYTLRLKSSVSDRMS